MKQFNFTYQTKNLVNGKTYIGVHSTNNLKDGYIGCGVWTQSDTNDDTHFHRAVDKYGYENFKCIPLCFFDTKEEAFEEEKFLVDQTWVKCEDNYNIALGGLGGDTWFGMSEEGAISRKKSLSNFSKRLWSSYTPEQRLYRVRGLLSANKNRQYSEETRKKMSESAKGRTDNRGRGYKHSKKTIQKLKQNATKHMIGQKYETVSCPHCNKTGGLNAMPRWHFDNCKSKVI